MYRENKQVVRVNEPEKPFSQHGFILNFFSKIDFLKLFHAAFGLFMTF